MRLMVLFALRASYETPEALVCMTQYEHDENPQWWDEEVERQKEKMGSDAVGAAFSTIFVEVDERAVVGILRPPATSIPGEVVGDVAG